MTESAMRKSILVVDDEEDVRRYLAAILEDGGFDVETAPDGNRALDVVKEKAPDLISLDLVMPEKSGIRFLHALRRDKEWARIPVLIVTGHAHDDLGKKDLGDILAGKMISGPEVYLEKPVSPASYVLAVRRQLGLPDEEEAPAAPGTPADDELESLIAGADEETRKKVLEMLRKQAKG